MNTRVVLPREDADPIRAFVVLERFNAIRSIQAIDHDLQMLTKYESGLLQHAMASTPLKLPSAI